MRVLLISGSIPPMKCGVGDYSFCLAQALSCQDNLIVGVLTDEKAKEYENSQYAIEVFPIIKKWNINVFLKLYNFISRWKPDIIHIQFPSRGYQRSIIPHLLPLFFFVLKIPVIQTWHEPLSWKGRFRYLPNILFKNPLIFVEPDYLEFLPKWYRHLLERMKCFFIPIQSMIPRYPLTKEEVLKVRAKYADAFCNLIAYFGFASPQKGIEALFKIANPEKDRIILICEFERTNPYHLKLIKLSKSDLWAGKSFVTGYMSKSDVGKLLASVDAVVLPFLKGVSWRNSSFLAAKVQGTFVLTTHLKRHGYYRSENVYYARINDFDDMRKALNNYVGKKRSMVKDSDGWNELAHSHVLLYTDILKKKAQISDKN